VTSEINWLSTNRLTLSNSM